jgi:hypothetical protein
MKSFVLASLMLVGTVYGDGFGVGVGPFSLQFGSSAPSYLISNRNSLDNPICYAISHQKRLEIIVEGAENVSTKEKRIISKRLVVEPYAFGVNKDDQPILRGNVVEEKLLKEVSVKYGDDQFDETSVAPEDSGGGFFSGLFSSSKVKNLDIRKVVQVHVIDDSRFEIPKGYKPVDDKDIRVICELKTGN